MVGAALTYLIGTRLLPESQTKADRSNHRDHLRADRVLTFPLVHLDLVPVRGYAKGWNVKFEGIAA